MARRLCFSYWLLVCWVVVTVAEGQKEGVTPPGGSQDNGGPTDCQIFTLSPPPPRRNPVTRTQLVTRTPKYFLRGRLWRGSSSEESR
ncbi:odontogenesis associated phosphoprotein [Neomonachus schauinslandi]|uniref:Odontogenesis associated phosphoprotein n=1 Tax=Neomonachus schauinslandi TaxID=29088 RepID=A0A2Y9I1X9_NEOSC|nr:odontogenesis associated phosphoprotein [Neomonachus schauinslandi]